jgi:Xaa-Pro aminopeptidase
MIEDRRRAVNRMRALATRVLVAAAVSLVPASPAAAQREGARERSEREWRVKAEKMQLHLQPLMRRHGIDMWVIMSHEHHPDPALELFGAYGITGWYGHRNAYVIHDPGGDAPLDRVVFGTHLSGHLEPFFPRLQSYGEEGLAPHLAEYVQSKNPRRIAINQSRTISMADGISVELKDYLVKAIGPDLSARITSSEPLFIDYVSVRTPEELLISLEASEKTWNILRRAFSNEVITPGTTTLMDVHWWIVDEWRAQGLDFNFPPGLSLQREGLQGGLGDVEDPVIQPGDVLHVDFGIKLMGIVTDQQKNAYVLRPGETEPPAGLREGFAKATRMAHIIAEELVPGREGRQVKAAAEARGKAEGIENLVYSHTQGTWVHDAGAWAIHDWPERYGNHPREPVRATEFWSIEYSVSAPVPEWNGQTVRFGREEDAWVGEDGRTRFMTGPQSELWLIRPVPQRTATDSPAGGASR